MKYEKLKDGEQLQVGYILVHITAFGNQKYKVYILTKKYAWVKYNDVAEGKFPLIYSDFGFTSLPKQHYETSTWKAYKPL